MLFFLYGATSDDILLTDSGRSTPNDQASRSSIVNREVIDFWCSVRSQINFERRWVASNPNNPVLRIPIERFLHLEANALVIYALLNGSYVTLPSHIDQNCYNHNLEWLHTAHIKTISEGKLIIANGFFVMLSTNKPSFIPENILKASCQPSIFFHENSDDCWSMPSSVGPSTNTSAHSTPEKPKKTVKAEEEA